MSDIVQIAIEVNEEITRAVLKGSLESYDWQDILRQLEVIIPREDMDTITKAMLGGFAIRRALFPQESVAATIRDVVMHSLLVGIRLAKRGLV